MQASADLDRSSAALLAEHLTKVYDDGTTALEALQLRIPAGCFFGLLGPNGAGKTTVIGIVSGLVRAAAGHVFVFGHDVVADPAARPLVGVAPQDVHLDRFLTARKMLVLGRYFGMPRRSSARTSCSRSSTSVPRRTRSRTDSSRSLYQIG